MNNQEIGTTQIVLIFLGFVALGVLVGTLIFGNFGKAQEYPIGHPCYDNPDLCDPMFVPTFLYGTATPYAYLMTQEAERGYPYGHPCFSDPSFCEMGPLATLPTPTLQPQPMEPDFLEDVVNELQSVLQGFGR